MEGAQKGAMLLMERAARLYRPGTRPFTGEEISGRLASLKTRLASPEALVMQQYLLADPLGFSRDALRGLEAAGGSMGAQIVRGRMVSADERFGLVIAKLDFDPFDVERSARFTAALDKVLVDAQAGDKGDAVPSFAVETAGYPAVAAYNDPETCFSAQIEIIRKLGEHGIPRMAVGGASDLTWAFGGEIRWPDGAFDCRMVIDSVAPPDRGASPRQGARMLRQENRPNPRPR